MPDLVFASGDAPVERLEAVPSLLERGERLLSPAAAAKASKIPGHRGGEHLNGSTVFRHITKGVRTPDGRVIRLEAVRIGCRWLTSVEAIARFGSRLAAASLPSDDAPTAPPTPRQRSRAAAAASKRAAAIFGAADGK